MPPEELTYREGIQDRMERFENDVRQSLARLETSQEVIDKKVSFTNGKVRKITIALVLIAGVLIGQNFTTPHAIINLLSHAL